jgi:polyphenol oxidase
MNPLFDIPEIFQQFPNLIAAQSTRLGGVSEAPYFSLNLGKSTADLPENITENRMRFFGALGIDLSEVALSYQVHGAEILLTSSAGNFQNYDAIITATPNVFVAVSVADCTPILIYDAEKKVLAAIHAGWRGTVAGIVAKTLGLMQTQFQTEAQNCYAYIGTCIDELTFEVGAEVASEFEPRFKRFDQTKQKWFVDLKNANKHQLLLLGVPEQHIEVSPNSTILNNDRYFSHREENGITGRMMAVIGLRL